MALLRKWWGRSCKNLGIEGVSLNPGTRHSSLPDVAEKYGYQTAKDLSGHTTSKSLDRYLVLNREGKKDLHSYVRSDKEKVKDFDPSKNGKLLDLKDKGSRGRGI